MTPPEPPLVDPRFAVDLDAGMDTDNDGLPDTVVLPDDEDLVVAADTDADGLVDLLIEIGGDGVAVITDLAELFDDGAGPLHQL